MTSDEDVREMDHHEARMQLDSLAADRVGSSAQAAAPWWLLALQGMSVAGFALSFGLGNWQSAGFSVCAVIFVVIGMIRPAVTHTRAEPWSTSKSALRPGAFQILAAIVAITLGVVTYTHLELAWALWPAAAISFATTILFGLQMERALSRDIAEGV